MSTNTEEEEQSNSNDVDEMSPQVQPIPLDMVNEQVKFDDSPIAGISDSSPDNPFSQVPRDEEEKFSQTSSKRVTFKDEDGSTLPQIKLMDSKLKTSVQTLQQQSNKHIGPIDQQLNSKIQKGTQVLAQKEKILKKKIDEHAEKAIVEADKLVTHKAKQIESQLNSQLEQHQKQLDQATQEAVQKIAAQQQKLSQMAPVVGIVAPQLGNTTQKMEVALNKASSGVQQVQSINRSQTLTVSSLSNTGKNLLQQNAQAVTTLGVTTMVGLGSQLVDPIAAQMHQKKLFSQAGMERKQEQYEVLVQWESYRDKVMSQHRKLCEAIFERIERRFNVSDQSMQKLIAYFLKRCEQEELCSKFYREQSELGQLFKEKDDKVALVYYPQFTNTLVSVDGCSKEQARQIDSLINHIKGVIKNQFEVELENYRKQFKDVRDTYTKQLKRVQDSQTALFKYYQKYHKYFLEHTKKATSKDLYNQEMKYKQISQNLLFDLRSLGTILMDKWEYLLQLECQRLNLIKKQFQELQRIHISVYGKTELLRQQCNFIDEIKPIDEVESYWSVKSVLKGPEQEMVKSIMKADDCSVTELRNYLIRCPIVEEQRSHPLILKQLKAFRDVGHVGKSWREIEIIVTVDYNVLIYDEPKPGIYTKAVIKFSAAGVKMKHRSPDKQDKVMVDLQYKTPGLLLDSKKKLLIKFHNSDDQEELDMFLNKVL